MKSHKNHFCPLFSAYFILRSVGLFFKDITIETLTLYFTFLFLSVCFLDLLQLISSSVRFPLSRCAVPVETLDLSWSLLRRADRVEPKVLCGCWLSDAAAEWGGGGGESMSVVSFCVTVVFVVCSCSSLFVLVDFSFFASLFRPFPYTHFQ